MADANPTASIAYVICRESGCYSNAMTTPIFVTTDHDAADLAVRTMSAWATRMKNATERLPWTDRARWFALNPCPYDTGAYLDEDLQYSLIQVEQLPEAQP